MICDVVYVVFFCTFIFYCFLFTVFCLSEIPAHYNILEIMDLCEKLQRLVSKAPTFDSVEDTLRCLAAGGSKAVLFRHALTDAFSMMALSSREWLLYSPVSNRGGDMFSAFSASINVSSSIVDSVEVFLHIDQCIDVSLTHLSEVSGLGTNDIHVNVNFASELCPTSMFQKLFVVFFITTRVSVAGKFIHVSEAAVDDVFLDSDVRLRYYNVRERLSSIRFPAYVVMGTKLPMLQLNPQRLHSYLQFSEPQSDISKECLESAHTRLEIGNVI